LLWTDFCDVLRLPTVPPPTHLRRTVPGRTGPYYSLPFCLRTFMPATTLPGDTNSTYRPAALMGGSAPYMLLATYSQTDTAADVGALYGLPNHTSHICGRLRLALKDLRAQQVHRRFLLATEIARSGVAVGEHVGHAFPTFRAWTAAAYTQTSENTGNKPMPGCGGHFQHTCLRLGRHSGLAVQTASPQHWPSPAMIYISSHLACSRLLPRLLPCCRIDWRLLFDFTRWAGRPNNWRPCGRCRAFGRAAATRWHTQLAPGTPTCLDFHFIARLMGPHHPAWFAFGVRGVTGVDAATPRPCCATASPALPYHHRHATHPHAWVRSGAGRAPLHANLTQQRRKEHAALSPGCWRRALLEDTGRWADVNAGYARGLCDNIRGRTPRIPPL